MTCSDVALFQVEASPLSIIVPLLVRGLRERTTAIKRKACVIIDNMAKLVEVPWDAAPFLPKLIPELEKVKEEVADPECRKVAANAYATLMRVGGEGKATAPKPTDAAAASKELDAFFPKAKAALDATTFDFVVARVGKLIDYKHFEEADWQGVLVPFLAASEPEAAKKAAELASKCQEDAVRAAIAAEQDNEEGEDLCNCEFSLAYGAKILLNNARLRLKVGPPSMPALKCTLMSQDSIICDLLTNTSLGFLSAAWQALRSVWPQRCRQVHPDARHCQRPGGGLPSPD